MPTAITSRFNIVQITTYANFCTKACFQTSKIYWQMVNFPENYAMICPEVYEIVGDIYTYRHSVTLEYTIKDIWK